MRALGVDLGGTKIAGAIVEEGRIVSHAKVPSNIRNAFDLAQSLKALLALLDGPTFSVAGIGAAGIVDRAGRYIYGPNTSLRDVELPKIGQEVLGVETFADNDANCAALAEQSGAALGFDNFVMVTMGTGLGCAIVIDGKVVRGHNGAAGEGGHMLLQAEGLVCGCGNRGCWEQYASGRALERMGREMKNVSSAERESATGPQIVEWARQGNEEALSAVRSIGRWTGRGLGSLVNLLDPGVIVIGGGMVDALDLFREEIDAGMREVIEASELRAIPAVVAAKFGADSGVLGAAMLATQGYR